MNIRVITFDFFFLRNLFRIILQNAKQLPALTPAEKAHYAATLRLQFPVSSGNQHRTKEHENVRSTEILPGATTDYEKDTIESVESQGDISNEKMNETSIQSVFPHVSTEVGFKICE